MADTTAQYDPLVREALHQYDIAARKQWEKARTLYMRLVGLMSNHELAQYLTLRIVNADGKSVTNTFDAPQSPQDIKNLSDVTYDVFVTYGGRNYRIYADASGFTYYVMLHDSTAGVYRYLFTFSTKEEFTLELFSASMQDDTTDKSP